ncbi:SWI5-dependent HO expression protein 4 [Coemansia spiralis]|nr:SWI5-dependent HO expression protein 4 [Coemansia spiralis]
MTATAAAAASSASVRQTKLREAVDSITEELQANRSAAPTLLLRRAQAYADLGEEALARDDVARTAELVKDPQHKTPESVGAVERALREMAIASRATAAGDTADDGTASVEELVAHIMDNNAPAAAVLEQRILAKRAVLTAEQICGLVDSFHGLCARTSTMADNDTYPTALVSCISAAHSSLAPAAALIAAVAHTVRGWLAHDTDGEFKQRACRHGAKMYASAAHALAAQTGTGDADSEALEVLREAYGFYVTQVWPVGVLLGQSAGSVCEGALRLLTANRPLFVFAFASGATALKPKRAAMPPVEHLLALLGQPGDTEARSSRSLAMLLASQLSAAAKDPENSAMFPGYDAASRGSGPPQALAQLRGATAKVLDGWIQSTIQAERRQGLLAAAALYEAGAGADLAAELWLKSGWAEELWDQGEFDKPATQLALLELADACSTDAGVSAQMKKLGNGLVQALARKGAGSGGTAAGPAALASVVLAKWSGLPAAGAKAAAAVSAPAAEEPAQPTADADPIQLADDHIKRILAHAGSGDAANAVERSVEALGYLCLKPKPKEHVAGHAELLQALFLLARSTDLAGLRFAAVMLIGNLTRYRPVLSEEQKRMQQLQRLNSKGQTAAQAGEEAPDDADNELDAPEAVAGRAARVCSAGAITVLVAAVQTKARPSDSVKDAVAEIMVSLATSQALRGLLVQQGGVRALLGILTTDAPKAAITSSAAKAADGAQNAPKPLRQARDRDIAFALAKIAISVPPHLAFRDPREVARLLLALLAEDAAPQALLMKFEALLALTNLASAEPGSPDDVRGYICTLNGMSLVEMAVLSEHPLVRRAATELVCNLVYDADVFERFARDADSHVPAEDTDDPDAPAELLPSGIEELPSDDDGEAGPVPGRPGDDAYRAQRLHLLIALADVDDTATRSAAAGALAVLSSDARCCRYLFLAHPRAADVLLGLADDQTLDDDSAREAFQHRVAVVWANAAGCGDARVAAKMRRQPGLVECLRRMAADAQAPYCAAATSAVERLGSAVR